MLNNDNFSKPLVIGTFVKRAPDCSSRGNYTKRAVGRHEEQRKGSYLWPVREKDEKEGLVGNSFNT